MLNYQDGFSKTLQSGDSLNVTFEFSIADAQWTGVSMRSLVTWMEVDVNLWNRDEVVGVAELKSW